MLEIPIYKDESAFFKNEIELDGEKFNLFFHYNFRENCWLMDIENENEEKILSGIRLVENLFLLKQYKHMKNLPAGDFMIIKMNTNRQVELLFDNLGTDYILIYLEKKDL